MTASKIHLMSAPSMENINKHVEGSYKKAFNPFSIKNQSKDLVKVSSSNSTEIREKE